MGALFISLLTLVLILISAFVILLVLMQRTSQSGGMGAALGGGAAESAFGSDTNTVLTKATIYSIIAFFIVSLGLFLIYQSKASERTQTVDAKELISADTAEPVEEMLTRVEAEPAPETATVVDTAGDVVADAEASVKAIEVPEAPDAPTEVLVEEAEQTSD